MPDADDVAIGELPGLHGRSVDGAAVGGAEVVHHGNLAIEVDVDMPSGNGGVRQPEGRVLAAADDVRTVQQLVGAVGAVVHPQHCAQVGGRLLELLLAVSALVVSGLVVLTLYGSVVSVLLPLALTRRVLALLIPGILPWVGGLAIGWLAVPRLGLWVSRLSVWLLNVRLLAGGRTVTGLAVSRLGLWVPLLLRVRLLGVLLLSLVRWMLALLVPGLRLVRWGLSSLLARCRLAISRLDVRLLARVRLPIPLLRLAISRLHGGLLTGLRCAVLRCAVLRLLVGLLTGLRCAILGLLVPGRAGGRRTGFGLAVRG